jgi:hypothetical protein
MATNVAPGVAEAVDDRVHPLVPPLALAVITLVGAAVVIAAGHPGSAAEPRVLHRSPPYHGGKLAPRERPRPKPTPRPVELPAWVRRELGPVSPTAPLVRKAGPLRVTLTRRGFVLEYRDALLSRYATRIGRLRGVIRHRNGLERPFGAVIDVTTVRGSVTSSYLVVGRYRGAHTWTWRLQTNLQPRIQRNGGLLLLGSDSLLVLPPRVYDARGRNVTRPRLRWRLRGAGNAFVLSVRLNDRRLSLPYVISG